MSKMAFLFYYLAKTAVSFCFNLLNLLLGGHLPPLGCVSMIVEEEQRYLVIRRASGEYAFAGGFIRWRESPEEAVRREGREETGLELQVGDVVAYQVVPSRSLTRMSTFCLVYEARAVGGSLRGSGEGQPSWLAEHEVRDRLAPMYQRMFDAYQAYHSRHASATPVNASDIINDGTEQTSSTLLP
ncbi:MAG: NUDIX hydrolase [Ktedonobacteraceae bacterium]|nr:NUDIX hydrolase [Ktedonobacteraceae bacterium]